MTVLFAASGAAPPDPASWIATAARDLQAVVAAWWPALILTAAATAAATRLAIRVLHRARRREAARALWIQITPPATMPTDGARALWLAMSGLLSRSRRSHLGLRPARVSMEFVADASGTRVGVWVPPTLSASAVAALIQRCWPGARAAVTGPNPHPAGFQKHLVAAAKRLLVAAGA